MQSAIHPDGETLSQRRSALAIPFSKEGWLEDLLISLSIANLCFMFAWGQVGNLAGAPSIRYYETHAPGMGLIGAVLVDIVVLGAGLFLVFRLRRTKVPPVRWTATAVIVFFSAYAFYDLQRSLQPFLDRFLPYRQSVVLRCVLGIGAVAVIAAAKARAPGVIRIVFLILSPLLLIMAGNTAWTYATNDLHKVGSGRAAGMLPGATHTNRLIWIIFDELDERMLFTKRPARIHLAEFDRLRRESIYAGHVKSPAAETLESIPSLFLGKTVTHTKLDTSKLLIKGEGDQQWLDFGSQLNIFRRARAAGFNTALSGWNHPYCRILGSDLSDCAWDNGGWTSLFVERYLRQKSLAERALYIAHWQSRFVPLLAEPPHFRAPRGFMMYRQNNIAVMQSVWTNAERMLRNPKLNLVFLHFPVPHPPGIWNRGNEKFTTANSNYIDNLQLADDVLGRVRRELEAVHDWNRSTILVTADHPYRASMWLAYTENRTAEMVKQTGMKTYPYVPFLVKLPGALESVNFSPEFNNVLTSDLIWQILNGGLVTSKDTVAWLDAHAGSSESE